MSEKKGQEFKIVSYRNPTSEGICLEFDIPVIFNKPISNSGLKSKEVWISWDKLSEILNRYVNS